MMHHSLQPDKPEQSAPSQFLAYSTPFLRRTAPTQQSDHSKLQAESAENSQQQPENIYVPEQSEAFKCYRMTPALPSKHTSDPYENQFNSNRQHFSEFQQPAEPETLVPLQSQDWVRKDDMTQSQSDRLTYCSNDRHSTCPPAYQSIDRNLYEGYGNDSIRSYFQPHSIYEGNSQTTWANNKHYNNTTTQSSEDLNQQRSQYTASNKSFQQFEVESTRRNRSKTHKEYSSIDEFYLSKMSYENKLHLNSHGTPLFMDTRSSPTPAIASSGKKEEQIDSFNMLNSSKKTFSDHKSYYFRTPHKDLQLIPSQFITSLPNQSNNPPLPSLNNSQNPQAETYTDSFFAYPTEHNDQSHYFFTNTDQTHQPLQPHQISCSSCYQHTCEQDNHTADYFHFPPNRPSNATTSFQEQSTNISQTSLPASACIEVPLKITQSKPSNHQESESRSNSFDTEMQEQEEELQQNAVIVQCFSALACFPKEITAQTNPLSTISELSRLHEHLKNTNFKHPLMPDNFIFNEQQTNTQTSKIPSEESTPIRTSQRTTKTQKQYSKLGKKQQKANDKIKPQIIPPKEQENAQSTNQPIQLPNPLVKKLKKDTQKKQIPSGTRKSSNQISKSVSGDDTTGLPELENLVNSKGCTPSKVEVTQESTVKPKKHSKKSEKLIEIQQLESPRSARSNDENQESIFDADQNENEQVNAGDQNPATAAAKNKFDTKNLVKNFLNQFVSFVMSEEAIVKSLLTFDSSQLAEYQDKLKTFFKNKKFNRALLKDFIHIVNYRDVFSYFLQHRAQGWIAFGRMKDKPSHFRALSNFIYICQNHDEIKSWRFRYNFV